MFCIFAFEKKDGGDFKIVFKLLTLKKWRYKHYTALFLWTMIEWGRIRRGGGVGEFMQCVTIGLKI